MAIACSHNIYIYRERERHHGSGIYCLSLGLTESAQCLTRQLGCCLLSKVFQPPAVMFPDSLDLLGCGVQQRLTVSHLSDMRALCWWGSEWRCFSTSDSSCLSVAVSQPCFSNLNKVQFRFAGYFVLSGVRRIWRNSRRSSRFCFLFTCCQE